MRIAFAVVGTLLITVSAVWGLMFGITEQGPPLQGVIGGLVPTLTAIIGMGLLMTAARD